MNPSQKNWGLKISTFVVVTACFAVMATTLLVSQNFKKFLTLWGEEVQMTIYVAENISDKNYQYIEDKLKASGKTKNVQLITKEKALEGFRTQLASYAPDVAQDSELLKLIPASIQVSLADTVPIAEQLTVLRSLSAELKEMEGVDEVTYGQEWITKYAAFVSAIEAAFGVLGMVILAASLFVMSNTIRASIQNRKEEIVVLEMVGATSSMIRKPFMLEGALLGSGSSIMALAFCFTVFIYIKNLLVSKLNFIQLGENLQFISVSAITSFIVLGGLLGMAASYICVRNINNGFASRQG
ncbi:MAG: cell division protein FtsX [Bdellovibrio sp.]